MSDIDDIKKKNFEHFIERGPGLSVGYGIYVVARCRDRKMVLKGGLGGMGVGQMWFPEYESDAGLPGYEDAPEQEPDGWSLRHMGPTEGK